MSHPAHGEDNIHTKIDVCVGGKRGYNIGEGTNVGRTEDTTVKGVADVPFRKIDRYILGGLPPRFAGGCGGGKGKTASLEGP